VSPMFGIARLLARAASGRTSDAVGRHPGAHSVENL
jgi:hypothetical protein